jgi:hypothetical protein
MNGYLAAALEHRQQADAPKTLVAGGRDVGSRY